MNMTALILAGGAGTRLRPLTYHRPKPMVPIAGKPILQYQIELLARHGFRDIVLCIGASTDSAKEYFGNGSELGLNIHYSVEDTPLGTAGAIRNAEEYLTSDYVLVMNGDGLVDYDLSAITGFHNGMGAEATIGLMEVPTPTPCGAVKVDDNSRALSFEEPDKAQKQMLGVESQTTGFALVNAGVYIIAVESLQIIPKGLKVSIEREFFPYLIEHDGDVYASLLSGRGLDIGAPNQYLDAHRELLSGRINADIDGKLTEAGYWLNGTSQIDPSAEIERGVFIGPSCKIGARVRIAGFTSLGPGCIIGEDSVVESSVLLERVRVGANCRLQGCIADSDCRFSDGTIPEEGSTIAANTII